MFFRALPDRCLSEKGRGCKGGKHSKVRMTVAFIVSATGGKVTGPIVIWKSKIPRCFRYLEDKSRPANLHYFSNEKSWMNTDKILSMLDAKMKSQNRNVILFIDNDPCHPPDLKGKFSDINVCFLPKNTTSRLQPIDAGVIQNVKVKYRKLLLKFVISRVNDKKTASEIVKEVDVLKAIRWVKEARNQVDQETIRKGLCGFIPEVYEEIESNNQIDTEFEELVRCIDGNAWLRYGSILPRTH